MTPGGLVDVVDEEPLLHPDLGRGQPDARRLAHGDEHVVDQLGHGAVDVGDFGVRLLQHGVAEDPDGHEGHRTRLRGRSAVPHTRTGSTSIRGVCSTAPVAPAARRPGRHGRGPARPRERPSAPWGRGPRRRSGEGVAEPGDVGGRPRQLGQRGDRREAQRRPPRRFALGQPGPGRRAGPPPGRACSGSRVCSRRRPGPCRGPTSRAARAISAHRVLGGPEAGGQQLLVEVEEGDQADAWRAPGAGRPRCHHDTSASRAGRRRSRPRDLRHPGPRTSAVSSSARRVTPGRSGFSRVAPHSAHTRGRRAAQTRQTSPSPSSLDGRPAHLAAGQRRQVAQASSRARPLRFSTQTTRRPASTGPQALDERRREEAEPGGSSRRSATSTIGQPARSSLRPGSSTAPPLAAAKASASCEGTALESGRDAGTRAAPASTSRACQVGARSSFRASSRSSSTTTAVRSGTGAQAAVRPHHGLAAEAGPGPVGGRPAPAPGSGRRGSGRHHHDRRAGRRHERLHEGPPVDGRRDPVHVDGRAGAGDRRHRAG